MADSSSLGGKVPRIPCARGRATPSMGWQAPLASDLPVRKAVLPRAETERVHNARPAVESAGRAQPPHPGTQLASWRAGSSTHHARRPRCPATARHLDVLVQVPATVAAISGHRSSTEPPAVSVGHQLPPSARVPPPRWWAEARRRVSVNPPRRLGRHSPGRCRVSAAGHEPVAAREERILAGRTGTRRSGPPGVD